MLSTPGSNETKNPSALSISIRICPNTVIIVFLLIYFSPKQIPFCFHLQVKSSNSIMACIAPFISHNENNHRDTLVGQDILEYTKSRIKAFASKA